MSPGAFGWLPSYSILRNVTCVPDPVLGTGDTAVDHTDGNLFPQSFHCGEGERTNKNKHSRVLGGDSC